MWEKRYWQLFHKSNDAIFIHNLDCRIVNINPQALNCLDYNKMELMNSVLINILPQEEQENFRKYIRISNEQRIPVFFKSKFYKRNGEVVDVECDMESFDEEHLQTIVRILPKRNYLEALAEEKERLSVTLRSIGDGVIVTDIEGKINLINQAAEKITGWIQEDALGRKLDDIFHIIEERNRRKAIDPIKEIIEETGIGKFPKNAILLKKNGNECMVISTGSSIHNKRGAKIGLVLIFKDITENRKMEKEMSKVQKLESIGVLAGGIAHDFNNILMAILGNISLAKSDIDPESETYEIIEEVENAAQQAKKLTQQLLTFAKGGKPIKETAYINQLLKDSTRFALRGSKVICKFGINEDLNPVDIDLGQISQVLYNLIVNAVQSMPQGGKIQLNAQNFYLEENFSFPLKEGEYVKISIQDQGEGIDPKNLTKIFDPYFTTKEQGSGLGLATSYSIIRKHGGYITVDSILGEGTIFNIYFPVSEHDIRKTPETSGHMIFGSGKILVMDDQKLVRKTSRRMHEYLGYEVDFAQTGEEAIQLYEKAFLSDEPYRAIIVDLTVPGGKGGEEIIQKLKSIDPNVKAIVSSGYANSPIITNYAHYGFSAGIVKPFEIKTLSKILNRVLNTTD